MIDSPVISGCVAYFRTIEEITVGKQNAYYKWLINAAMEVDLIRKMPIGLHIVSRRKQRCFSNSARVSIDNPDVSYVEGYMDCNGTYIEHAWNRTADGKYFDVTVNDHTMKYYAILELDFHDVLDMIEYNHNRFGPFLMKHFYKNIYRS